MPPEPQRTERRGRIGTWELDFASHALRASCGFKKLFGQPADAPLEFSQLLSLLQPKDCAGFTDAIHRCAAERTDLEFELRLPVEGETLRCIELRAELDLADDGSALRLRGVALDATVRLAEEEARHRTAILLRGVLENASGLIYAKDRSGRMLIANPPTLELIGKTWQEVEGRTDAEFLEDAAQGSAVMANDRRIMDSGQPEVLEERVGSDDGRTRTWLSTKTPLRDDAGEIIGLVGISQDITDRKLAEQKLLDLNETLEARVAERTRERDGAWNRSQDLLLVLDAAGTFKAVNPAWTAVLGWDRDELLGRNQLDLIHPDDHPGSRDALAHAAAALLQQYENRYRHKNGTYRWISWSATPEGDRIYASGRHVTAEKEAEMALAEKTVQLQTSIRELESFSYSISHDLRAPLRAIDGFGMMLEEDCAERLDPEGRRLLSTIRENSQRMGQLIDDLLAFSRLAHAPLAATEVDVDSMVREVIEELAATAAAKPVEFDVDRLPLIHGDRGLLRQVWINLLSNAVKYSGKQSMPRVQVRGRMEGGEIIYSISDNGVGFDMKYADKLFGVFQRMHSASDFGGTGVGLAIVQRIVMRHGGRVWASAAPNHGAEFSFALPKPVA